MFDEPEDTEDETEVAGKLGNALTNNVEMFDLEDRISQCIESLDCASLGENLPAFRSRVRREILHSYLALKPPTDPLKILLNTDVNCSSIFRSESQLWFSKIKGSLTRKPRIRNPYEAEIVRPMPLEVFLVLKRAVEHTRLNNITTNVTFDHNNKAHVMSFSSVPAVICLFSQLSALSQTDVKSHLKISQSGRMHGKASVIVNTEKDFTFMFKIKPMQLNICFYYGMWNKAGFPLHH